jgi:hypothetical protein
VALNTINLKPKPLNAIERGSNSAFKKYFAYNEISLGRVTSNFYCTRGG